MNKILIGIATLNNPTVLENCLNSIYETHDIYRHNVKLIVIDDCSTEEHLEENKRICAHRGLDLLMNNQRSGIPTSWNTLVNHIDADYYVILNDDVLLVHHWLDALIFTLKHNPTIGVVGLNAYEGENSAKASNNTPTYVESKILLGSGNFPVLSARGYAFAFRKEDFKAINGFDQNYFCFFEEVDFNLSMMKIQNKRNCILSFPVIKHIHGATLLKFHNHSDIFLESKRKFEEKWQTKWENLREVFNKDTIPKIEVEQLNEWNSNISAWV